VSSDEKLNDNQLFLHIPQIASFFYSNKGFLDNQVSFFYYGLGFAMLSLAVLHMNKEQRYFNFKITI